MTGALSATAGAAANLSQGASPHKVPRAGCGTRASTKASLSNQGASFVGMKPSSQPKSECCVRLACESDPALPFFFCVGSTPLVRCPKCGMRRYIFRFAPFPLLLLQDSGRFEGATSSTLEAARFAFTPMKRCRKAVYVHVPLGGLLDSHLPHLPSPVLPLRGSARLEAASVPLLSRLVFLLCSNIALSVYLGVVLPPPSEASRHEPASQHEERRKLRLRYLAHW